MANWFGNSRPFRQGNAPLPMSKKASSTRDDYTRFQNFKHSNRLEGDEHSLFQAFQAAEKANQEAERIKQEANQEAERVKWEEYHRFQRFALEEKRKEDEAKRRIRLKPEQRAAEDTAFEVLGITAEVMERLYATHAFTKQEAHLLKEINTIKKASDKSTALTEILTERQKVAWALAQTQANERAVREKEEQERVAVREKEEQERVAAERVRVSREQWARERAASKEQSELEEAERLAKREQRTVEVREAYIKCIQRRTKEEEKYRQARIAYDLASKVLSAEAESLSKEMRGLGLCPNYLDRLAEASVCDE
jgi:hypothetical protein